MSKQRHRDPTPICCRDPTPLSCRDRTPLGCRNPTPLGCRARRQVQQALYNNLKGRTVIVIAHRLSTVEKASRIIVIERGRVVEQGSHADLLRRGPAGLYSRLVKRQLLGFDVGFTDHVTRPPAEATDAAGGAMATAARDSFLSLNDDAGSNASKSQSPPTRYGSMC